MMDFLKSFLEPGTIVGIIGAAIGIWGLWVGYKGKRTQILEHQISSAQIITNRTNNIPGLKIVVGDEFASDLISSKIEFFNRGNTTIMQKDFASTAPLQIVTSGHFFNTDTISNESIESSNSNLNPDLKISGTKTLTISFEYLKPKQFFSITVLHDGDISIHGDLTVGKIQPVQNSSDERNRPRQIIKRLRTLALSGIFFGIMMTIMLVFSSLFSSKMSSSQTKSDQLLQQIEYLQVQNENLMETVDTLYEVIFTLQDRIEGLHTSLGE